MSREILRGPKKILLLVNLLLLVIIISGGCTDALGRSIAQGWAGGVVVDDTIIVGSRGGKILALDATDGTIQGNPIVITKQLPSTICGGGGTSGVAIYSSPVIYEFCNIKSLFFIQLKYISHLHFLLHRHRMVGSIAQNLSESKYWSYWFFSVDHIPLL